MPPMLARLWGEVRFLGMQVAPRGCGRNKKMQNNGFLGFFGLRENPFNANLTPDFCSSPPIWKECSPRSWRESIAETVLLW